MHMQNRVEAVELTAPGPASSAKPACMAALISALSRYFAKPCSVQSLNADLPLDNGIVQEAQLAAVAQRAGLSCERHECTLDQLDVLSLPALLMLSDGRACILLEYRGSSVVVLTSSGGCITREKQIIEADYVGRAYTLQPSIDHEIKQQVTPLSGHWFWSLAWEHRRIYLEASVGSFVVNILALALPLFIMAIYDRVIPNYALESLWVMLSGMLLVVVIDFILRQLRIYALDHAGRRIDTFLGNRVFVHILNTRLDQLHSSGAMANAMRELDVLREFLNSSATLSLISDVPFLFLFILMIYFIAGSLAWVPVIILPIVLLITLFSQFPLYRLTRAAYLNASNRNSVLFEVLNGLETVKALGAESWAASRWEKAHAAGVKTAFASRFYSQVNQSVLMVAQTLSMLAIITLGVFLIHEGQLSFGALFAAVILNGRVMAPISQIAQILGRLHAVYVAYWEIDRIMCLPTERNETVSSVDCPVISGNITIDRLGFAYPTVGQREETNVRVLEEVSFKITQGERLAIVGTIGSGKTTLLKLMLNLISPDAGTLRIEGIDSRELDPAELRSQIAYMPQNLHFFSGSIRENLTIHHPDALASDIEHVATIAGVADWLASCPLGLNQPVGERGEYLSGGQRQSLALARALLADPKLLLMDEPTSLLDSQSEQKFMYRMKTILDNKTLIIATHRPAMLELVDRIVVLDQGRIVMDDEKQVVLDRLSAKPL